ncbi:ABC transporter ATP-binding protein [Allofustis seminis]|uniref:ABC transporter ATP-binding protein n=1 Tax=Allofustis seminis TaxID=166939 RepID=UPI000369982C|nr:ABC transporter ATP-binding protein [Allofustis seminis]
MALEVKNLSGGYFQKELLKGISFQIENGEIVGLLGRNGAGKSTLYKSLMGTLPQMSGDVCINGNSINDNFTTYQKNVSYLPERPVFYPELTLWEHLELLKRMYHLPEKSLQIGDILLKQFALAKEKQHKPFYFSKGMQQKVMLIQTLMVDSPVLLLDEPFSGLDPLAVMTLRHLLDEKRQEGKIILLTTHLLHEAEQLCDRYLWLKDGRLILDGPTKESLEMLYTQILATHNEDRGRLTR